MIGSLVDRFFVMGDGRDAPLKAKINRYRHSGANCSSYWIYFVPEFCQRFSWLRQKLQRPDLTAEVYVLPKTIMQADPRLTKRYLDDIINDAIGRNQGRTTNILGISLGNVLAFRAASLITVGRLVAVVPGTSLSECAWDSIATAKILRRSGRLLSEFQSVLKDYNPIDYVDRISPRSIEIHVGGRDLMIPAASGEALARAVEKMTNAKAFRYPYSGHVGATFCFSRQFKP